MRDLEKLIKYLEGYYPVFGQDVKKEDVHENASFFLYNDKGEITRSQSGNRYLTNFYLHFVTRENKEIDEIEVIEYIRKNHSLIFDRTEIDYGKIKNLDENVKMITFIFHSQSGCY